MTTMMISIPDDLKTFIETQLVEKGFDSVGDYLLALIRDAEKRKARRELEAKIRAGFESPATEMTEADWKELEEGTVQHNAELRNQR